MKKNYTSLLETVGLCMECFGRNTITKDELYEILPIKEDRKLLEYSGIWSKTKDSYQFIHNNFGEFLASEILKSFSLDEIKKLITYENQENEIKSSWMNTLSFLLDSYHNNDLKKWIIDVFPEGIYYLEKNDFDEKTRNSIFKSFFETYENKNIWLPINILYGNAGFIDFISSKEIVDYLLVKIKEKKHYTIIYNSLSILMSFQNLYGRNNEIKKQLLELSINPKYTSQAKRYALKILADNGLIEENELLNIIEKNKNKEDAYIRTGYFYVFEKIGLTKKSIQIIFEKIDVVHKRLVSAKFVDEEDEDDDVNLLDEQLQFDKLFLNLNNYDLLKSVVVKIEELSKKEILHYFSEEMIKNICFSFLKLYKKNKRSFELIFRLYEVCSKNYDNDGLKIIPLELDKIGLRIELFKRFIELDEKRRFYADYHLVNNECLEYFMEEYKNQKYSDDLAREILSSSDANYECYNNLNSLYYERTGINLLEKRNKKIKDGCFKQDFFNVLFNVDEFIKCFNEFKIDIGISDVTIDTLKKIDYVFLEYNEKFQEMRHFFWYLKDKKIITEEYIKSLDWDWVILNECYKYLTRDKNLIVSLEQEKIIYDICKKYLSKASFENSIRYKESGDGYTTSYINIFLWYFRNKFNFVYPENVLLDMLDFDWTMEDYTHIGIDYIVKLVPAEKIRNRIINNINNKTMYDGVLKNQVNYCIENQVSGLSDSLSKYILDNNLSPYQKEVVIEYLLYDKGTNVVIDNYLKKVNFETEILILQKIFDIDKSSLSEYLEKKLKREKDEKKIILYSKYLIKCNNLFGLQKYYELLLRNKKDIDTSHNDSLKDALSKVNNCNLLDLVLKMYLLSFSKNFKDSRYESLYNGCRNAIINIGLSDIKNSSFDDTIKKLEELIENNSTIENIGFTYYIIDELKQKYNQTNQTKKNITTIVKELNVIFANNRQSKGIVF